MPTRNEIEAEVHRTIGVFLPSGRSINNDMNIIRDLKMSSDDATDMAISLERKYKRKIPRSEWSRVFTVEDVISLLVRYVDDKRL